VVSVDYLFGEQLVLRPTLSPQLYLLLVIASYIVGQVISHLSAVVLEQWLVKRLLGGSTGVLLAGEHTRWLWRRMRVRIIRRRWLRLVRVWRGTFGLLREFSRSLSTGAKTVRASLECPP
jgi:hypothetical protein